MDYDQWKQQLLENPRVDTIEPGVEQNPTLQKIKKAGDVGKREVLSRVTGQDVPSRNYAQTARNVTQDAGVVNWTDGEQPGDADDLEFTRQQALLQFAPDYAQAKAATNKELETQTPIEDLPLQDRMAKSFDAIAPMGGATGDKNVDDAMNDAVKASESPGSRGTIDGGEAGEMGDISYQRHKFQPEMELGYEITPDEVGTLMALVADDRAGMSIAQRGDQKGATRATPINRPESENPINALKYVSGGGGTQSPSGRDIENLNPEAMQQALEDGKITEEQFERQMKVLQALALDDAQGLQSALFQHEVSEDAIDAVYQYADLPASLATRGLTGQISDDARWTKAYGGNLPASMDKFKVKGAPDGVYNLYEMSKDPQGKKYIAMAKKNRERELIRTWLKQGGRDAYAHHEGIRSFLDMNLEHINNIAGEGNFDHPSNWVWASQELNKLKNEYNLIDRVKEFAQDKTSRQFEGGYDKMSFDKYLTKFKGNAAKEERKKWKAAFPEFRGAPKVGAGGMSQQAYDELGPEMHAEFRNRAMDLGASKEEAEEFFPAMYDRVDRKGYIADPDSFEARRQREENESILLQQWASNMKKTGQYKKQGDALKSPEGQEFRERLANWKGDLPSSADELLGLDDEEDFGA